MYNDLPILLPSTTGTHVKALTLHLWSIRVWRHGSHDNESQPYAGIVNKELPF